MQLAIFQEDPETGALTLLAGDPADNEDDVAFIVVLPAEAA